MRRVSGISGLIALLLLCATFAHAQSSTPTPTATATAIPAPVCNVGGNILTINGNPAISQRVVFDTYQIQNIDSLVPAGKFSVLTDSNGNLPNPTNVVQGLVVFLTVGSGQPVRITIPNATTANLSQLVQANTGPPSLVTQVQVAGVGSSGITVTNPPLGGIGVSTLNFNGSAIPGIANGTEGQFLLEGASQPGYYTLSGDISCSATNPGDCTVVGIQTIPVSTATPAIGDMLVYESSGEYVPEPASSLKGCPGPDGTYYASACGLVAAGTNSINYDNDATQALANQTAACNTLASMTAGTTFEFDKSGTNVYNFAGGISAYQSGTIEFDKGVIFGMENDVTNPACGSASAGSVAIAGLGNSAFTGSPRIGFPSTARQYNAGVGYLTQGQTCFNVTPSPAAETIGEQVYLQEGIDPDDGGQPYDFQWFTLSSVTSSQMCFTSGLVNADPPANTHGTNFDWHPSYQYNSNGTPGVTKHYVLSPSVNNAGFFSYEQTGAGTCTSGTSAPTFPQSAGSVSDGTCTWTYLGQQVFANTPPFSFSPTTHLLVAGLIPDYDFNVIGGSFIEKVTGSPYYDVLIYNARTRSSLIKDNTLIQTGEGGSTGGGIYDSETENGTIDHTLGMETTGSFISAGTNHNLRILNSKDNSAEHTGIYLEGHSSNVEVRNAELSAGASKDSAQLLFVGNESPDTAIEDVRVRNNEAFAAPALQAENDTVYTAKGITLDGQYILWPLRATEGPVTLNGQRFARHKQFTYIVNVSSGEYISYPFPSGLIKSIRGGYSDPTFTGLSLVYINTPSHNLACVPFQATVVNEFPTNGTVGDLTTYQTGGDTLEDFCTTAVGQSTDGAYNVNKETSGRTLWVQTLTGVPVGTQLTMVVDTLLPDGGDDGVGGAAQIVQQSATLVVNSPLWTDPFPVPSIGNQNCTASLTPDPCCTGSGTGTCSANYAGAPWTVTGAGVTITGITAYCGTLPATCSVYPTLGVNTIPAAYSTPFLTLGATPTYNLAPAGFAGGGYETTFTTPVFIPGGQVIEDFWSFGAPSAPGTCTTEPKNCVVLVKGHPGQ